MIDDDDVLIIDDSPEEEDVLIVPPLEEDIPLPKNAREAMPQLTLEQELQMRANTIKLLSDLSGNPIVPTEDQKLEAIDLARKMMTDPHANIDLTRYPNETMAFLAGLVAETTHTLVDDLAELKLFVINGLVKEAVTGKDSKTRLTALSKLGEIDGVDAFKKRTETVIKHQTLEEVEDELLKVLGSIKGRVIEGEVIESRVSE
jgi:hypothetical protein